MNSIDTHPEADAYLKDAAWPRNVLRQRVAVNAAADSGWDGSEPPTKEQLNAAVQAYVDPIAGVKNRLDRTSATPLVVGLLTDPSKSPFVDQVAVERALRFEQAALRGLTDMEWDALGAAMHHMGELAYGDRWDGDRTGDPAGDAVPPAHLTVATARDERRKAFLSLPADLTARVYEAAELAKHRIGSRSRTRKAVTPTAAVAA